MSLVLCLIAFSLEAELSVILESNRICRICTPNKNTLTLRKILSISVLFFFCFNLNVRQAGQRQLYIVFQKCYQTFEVYKIFCSLCCVFLLVSSMISVIDFLRRQNNLYNCFRSLLLLSLTYALYVFQKCYLILLEFVVVVNEFVNEK